MATVKLTAFANTTTLLSTGLNSLANVTDSGLSSAYDNSSNLDPFGYLELVLATTSSRSVGAVVDAFMVTSIDGGSTYPDGVSTVAQKICSFSLDAATTARVVTRPIDLPPGLFKVFLRNAMGTAMASSGNTLKLVTYDISVA